MRRTTEHDERTIRYLLGDLPETEQTAVEQEYFVDQEKFEEVWATENDLVDRYVRGRLSRRERELFERNYLQSPKHRERVAISRKFLEAADSQEAESGVSPRVIPPAQSRLTGILNALLRPRFLLPATAFLLMLSALSWTALERSRLNEELGKARSQLSDRQRRQREIAAQLDAEREQSGRWKSELDRLQETLAPKPPQSHPSIISFLLRSILSPRGQSADQQQIPIPRGTDLVSLRMEIAKGDSRRFRASIRTVGGSQVWSRRSLKPVSGAITVNVPADKLPAEYYFLKLSATTPTGETEEINRYSFRVVRK
ncbi:MAG TPA: hypothetical protein VKS99_08335 [Blastocatellia bacterium]|nr:hypothetical protein [Blastocatellia bacterium]